MERRLPQRSPASGGLGRRAGRAATIVGTAGADRLSGTSGFEVIVGGRGNDRIGGCGGNDLICAGAGNDRVAGGDREDGSIP